MNLSQPLSWLLIFLFLVSGCASDMTPHNASNLSFPTGSELPSQLPISQDSLTQAIGQAEEIALCTLERILADLEKKVTGNSTSIKDPVTAWNEHPDLIRWMGRLSIEDSLAPFSFRDLLQAAHARLKNREILYSMENSLLGRCNMRRTRAYVRLRERPPTIHLCPAWLEQSPGHRASTLVHETIHTFGYVHPRGTDTPAEALVLARTHPHLARQSPENIESLVELFICGH